MFYDFVSIGVYIKVYRFLDDLQKISAFLVKQLIIECNPIFSYNTQTEHFDVHRKKTNYFIGLKYLGEKSYTVVCIYQYCLS